MATLLDLCTETVDGLAGFEMPSTIIGNEDAVAVLLRSVATQVGRELVRLVNWQALKTAHSFATVAAVSAYSLPADYQRFANLTFWNTDEDQPLIGPVNGIDWAALNRGLTVLGIRYAFHVSGGFMNLTPTPTDVQNIGYDYYSRYFSTTALGAAQENWGADGDLWRLDPDIAVLGMRYRFRARKGLPFAEEKQDYAAAITALQFDDTPKPLIDVSGVPRVRYTGIPDGNWG